MASGSALRSALTAAAVACSPTLWATPELRAEGRVAATAPGVEPPSPSHAVPMHGPPFPDAYDTESKVDGASPAPPVTMVRATSDCPPMVHGAATPRRSGTDSDSTRDAREATLMRLNYLNTKTTEEQKKMLKLATSLAKRGNVSGALRELMALHKQFPANPHFPMAVASHQENLGSLLRARVWAAKATAIRPSAACLQV